MTPILRPYQSRGVMAARAHVLNGQKRVLLVGPTGSGKTVWASSIILSSQTFGAKVLFVVHRLELVDQTVKQLAKWGVVNVGVIRSNDERTNPAAPIQVATIQTLRRRQTRPLADIIFVDEAHLSAAISYRNLLDLYPDATVLGLTATPCRLDSKPLGGPNGFFQRLEVCATYADLIADGFIVAPRCFSTPKDVAPRLENVRTKHGDYAVDQLEAAMLESAVIGDTIAEYQKHCVGLRTVIFAVTVAHSRAILERLLAAGVRAAHVDANTPLEERREISKRLDAFELEVVTNVGIYQEGWDQPCVKGLVIARPTKSLVLMRQMSGRVLRPWNAKTPSDRSWLPEDGPSVSPVIVDQGNNIARHGFPHADLPWSLDDETRVPKEKKPAQCIKCNAYLLAYPCPECGFAPEPTERELKTAPQIELEEKAFEDPRRSFFDQKIIEARQKGFRPQWASVKYKEKFGVWPPWSWSQGAKSKYAEDEFWMRAVANRIAERERWKQNAEEMRTTRYDTDEDFAEWARRES